MPDFEIYKEFLILRSIHASTKGTDIFRAFQATLSEIQLDPSKLCAVATDGCPSMLGANQGLINKWREENDLAPLTWNHCILHLENLVAKSLDVSSVTKVVTSTVNWIRANALNHGKKSFLLMLMLTMVTWSCLTQCDG